MWKNRPQSQIRFERARFIPKTVDFASDREHPS
jgi:hypothetical protein